jgi:hypothetical protein
VSFLEQMLLGWECARSALRVAARPVVWPPWLLLAVTRIGAIGVLVMATHPLVSQVMAPLVEGLAGPGALHYPVLFRLLPRLVERVGLPVDVLLGGWAAGVASLQVVAMSDRATRSLGEAMARSLRRLPVLVAAQVPALALGWLLGDGATMWLETRGSGPLMTKAVGLVAAMLLGLVRVFCCWLPVIVVADGRGVTEAWSELGRLGSRGFGSALVVGLLTLVPVAPLAFALRAPGRWIDIGHPEWVALLLVLEGGVTILASFLATIALALAWRALEEDPWAG